MKLTHRTRLLNPIFTDLCLWIAITMSLSLPASAADNQGYYRYPSLQGNQLVFTAESDLWLAQLGNSKITPQRLTTSPELETRAKISKDGQWIAYNANYDGVTEAYVIGVNGGIPKRISFENSSTRVQGWTAKGEVLYATRSKVGPTGNWTLKLVDPNNLAERSIAVADANEGVIDSDGKNVYFVQFGLQVTGDHAKVYRGGAKGELWRYQLGSNKEAVRLTAGHVGSVRQPMLHGDRLYFISDASGRENIWSMSLTGQDFKQVTNFDDFAVRSASISGDQLIYRRGADLYKMNLGDKSKQSKVDERLAIALISDFSQRQKHWVNTPLENLTSSAMAGATDKVAVTARGRIAVAAVDHSRLVEVATPAKSRSRNAILSNDGKTVYALNDSSGELEIWQYPTDGSYKPKQLTKNGHSFRWHLWLSPDEKWLAHDDRDGNLWLLSTKTGKNRKISHQMSDPYSDVTWSKDSQLIAFNRLTEKDDRSHVVVYSLKTKKLIDLTSDKYESYSPAFSPDGNWLYFLSNRHFMATPSSPWGDRNTGAAFDKRTQIFAYGLNSSARFPFDLPNELNKTKSSDDEKESQNKKSTKKSAPIDWRKVKQRLWQVPIKSGNYSMLKVTDKRLYLLDHAITPRSKRVLISVKIEGKKNVESKEFASNVSNFQLSNDGKRVFLQMDQGKKANLVIVDAADKLPKDLGDATLNTKDWQMEIDPVGEWMAIFHDTWLMHRESLFDPQMRGMNWQQVKQKYQPLVSRITDRDELNDLFGQMTGELNALHSQVYGGDHPKSSNKVNVATLGAVYQQTSKGVVIDHLYQYDPELPSASSPLLKPGVNVQPGDRLLTINGRKIKTVADLNRQLLNQAGKQVLISLRRAKQTIKTIVVPVTSRQEFRFRYNDWVTTNRNKVEKAGKGKIGYLHLYAMGSGDFANFTREFYANYQKNGLIIDVRRNRGGNIDSWVIEKLMRRAWMFWQVRDSTPATNMQQAFRGHLVVLTDQLTYSDGETFSAGIKALKLAPLIGKRTAGAGVWLSGGNRTVDAGISRVAEYPQFSMDGSWAVEGIGIAPDIEVDNLPHATFNGKDAQLDAAVNYLKKELKDHPVLPLQPKALPRTGHAGDIKLLD